MKRHCFITIAAILIGASAADAGQPPEPAYMCVPTAGAGDALNVPNLGAWCSTPEHYVIDRETRALARMQSQEKPLATTSISTTRPSSCTMSYE